MSIDMYLGSSDQQAESVSAVLGNRMAAYESIQGALNGFVLASPTLSGLTYDSAKEYSSQLLIPLLKACILLDEAIKTACQKLPSEYRSRVDSVDLKESDLVAKIERVDRSIGRYMDLITIEQHKDKPNYPHISRLREAESQCRDLKMKLEEKLQKLREYNSASPQLFSKIDDLYQLVQQGLSQARTSWQAGSQSFSLPSRQELAWTKTVEELEIDYAYKSVITKVKKGKDLSEDDIEVIYIYAQRHPNEFLSQNLLKSINDFLSKTKEFYDDNDTNLDLIATIIEQLGIGTQRIGGLITILEGIRGPATRNIQGVSTAFVLVKQNGIGQALVHTGSKVTSFATRAGYGLMAVGFGLGMYDDMVNKDKNWGQALVHNGLSTGLSFGAGVGTSALIAFALGSNPIGWTAVGVAATAFAVSMVSSWIFETAYDNNFLGLQDGLDAAGDWLVNASQSVGQTFTKGVEDVKNWAEDLTTDVGQAISSGLGF